jgi:hypothetical protein
MVRRAFAFVSLFFLAFVGCGGSSGGGGNQFVSDCHNFISNYYCPKIVGCGIYSSQSGCVSAAESGLMCSAVKGENGNLGLCESDLASLSCYELTYYLYYLYELPPSCQGVFLE